VAQQTRFGDVSIVFLGLAVLALLSVLAAQSLRRPSEPRQNFMDLVLSAALAGEGFFTGYQVFWIQTLCVFCLSVLGIMTALGVLRLLDGRRAVLAGFASFAVLLGFSYLILPPAGGVTLPSEQQMVLFYTPDCKHCAEIKEEIAKNKLDVAPVLVKEYSATLKNLGIEHVPTLFVNGPYEKLLLTGKDAIRRYLASCRPGRTEPEKAAAKPAAKRAERKDPTPPAKDLPPLQFFTPLGSPNQLLSPVPDEGLCKEEQKCD
jgi:glutaredoxin